MAFVPMVGPHSAGVRDRFEIDDLAARIVLRDEKGQLLRILNADEEGGACDPESARRFGATLTAAIRGALRNSHPINREREDFRRKPSRRHFDRLLLRYERNGLLASRKALLKRVALRFEPSAIAGENDGLHRAARMILLADELRRVGEFRSAFAPVASFGEVASFLAAEPTSRLSSRLLEALFFALRDEFDLGTKAEGLRALWQRAESEASDRRAFAAAGDSLQQQIASWLAELRRTPANLYRVVPLGDVEASLRVLESRRRIERSGARLDRMQAEIRRQR